MVDWSPSDPEVLEPVAIEILGSDTTLCSGEAVQIEIEVGIADIEWISNTGSLSCTDCPDPIASPTESTVYQAVVDGVCIHDTVDVAIEVYQVDAGPDVTVCLGEDIQIVAGSNFNNAIYEWVGPNLSCMDCPDPVITGVNPGIFNYEVTLITPNCTLTDQMDLEVLVSPAPVFDVSDSLVICTGDDAILGDPGNDVTNTYSWSSDPSGFNSSDPNPTANPTESTTYYVQVSNGLCPTSSLDSIYVDVFQNPIVNVQADTNVCEGQLVTLANTIPENGVIYNWSPDLGLDFDTIANPTATISSTQTYTLTAINGACTITESVDVTSTVIDIDLQEPDSLLICKGEEVNLSAIASPLGTQITWTPDDGSISPTNGENVIATPQTATTYFAYVSVPGCEKFDSIYIDVDSIPQNLDIFPADTSVCAGSLVVLQTQTYEQFDFPDIEHQWQPNVGFQTPDSLLNMVIEAVDTILYTRTTTNGICTQIDSALITILTPTEIEIDPVNPSICEGESIQLTASSPDVTEFTWSPDDGSLSCTDCPDPVANPNSNTTYTVLGEFEDCPVEAIVQVEVVPDLISGIIEDDEICNGTQILLNTIQDPYLGTTYNWEASPPDPTLNPNDAMPLVSPLVTTTYNVTITNGVCDSIIDEILITVVNDAIVSAGEDEIICEGDDILLTATSTEPIGDFEWFDINGNLEGETASITVSPDVSDQYYVVFTNFCQQEGVFDTVAVEVLPGVDVTIQILEPDTITFDSTVFEGQQLTLFADLNGEMLPGASFTWSDGQTGQTIEVEAIGNEIINDTVKFCISVIITSADGCMYEDDKCITVKASRFQVPNVFTPNGDGTNDSFKVFYAGNLEVVDFKVFNRWGKLVYDNDDPQNGWDGTYKNELAPSDVYIYTISIRNSGGEIETVKGDVTLIR